MCNIMHTLTQLLKQRGICLMLEYTKREFDSIITKRFKELLQFTGGYVHLAKMLNISVSTAQGWFNRGHISKRGAKEVQKNKALNTKFTAIYLRPDL